VVETGMIEILRDISGGPHDETDYGVIKQVEL